MRKTLACFAFILGIVITSAPVKAIDGSTVSNPKIVISEVKVGGGLEPKEFVEFYNVSNQPVDVGGWVVEYLKADVVISDCSLFPWVSNLSSDVKTVEFAAGTVIEPRGTIMINNLIMNDSKSGSIRLVQPAGDGMTQDRLHDNVGWGTGATCFETQSVPLIPQSQSIKRKFSLDGYPIDSDNNKNDFSDILEMPTPNITPAVQQADLCLNIDGVQSEVPPGMGLDNASGECIAPQPVCDQLMNKVKISEILPNATGSDEGKEFIEFINQSDLAVRLDGCRLQIDNKTPISLDSLEIKPNGFLSIFNKELSFSLTNSSASRVFLLSENLEIDSIEYPANLPDDKSYALLDGMWQETYKATPGETNVIQEYLPCPDGQERNPSTGRCVAQAVASNSNLVACDANQYRNPETNRCKLIEVDSSSLIPCADNQYRNPDTNRCRTISSVASILKPCDQNQYRNPLTNRCRMISSASTTLIPCKQNQERNPITNRCRIKSASAAAKAPFGVEPVIETGKGFVGWWALGGVGGLAVGYAGWEWRREVSSAIKRVSSLLGGKGLGQ